MGFSKVVFPEWDQLLNNLFKVCWKWKNNDILSYKLTSLVSLQQGNVKNSEKLIKIDENS